MPKAVDSTPHSPLRRRLSLLRYPTSSPLSQFDTAEKPEVESPRPKKRDRTSSWLSQISNKSSENGGDESIPQKPSRLRIPSRNSFVSLSRVSDDRTRKLLSATSSPTTSFWQNDFGDLDPGHVVHHGEIQASSGFLRKSKEYWVLTDRFIFRFRNADRAAELLKGLTPLQRQHIRHNSSPSVLSNTSPPEGNSPTLKREFATDKISKIDLDQIIAVSSRPEFGPVYTMDLHWLEMGTSQLRSTTIQSKDFKSIETWIRTLSQQSRDIDNARIHFTLQRLIEKSTARQLFGEAIDVSKPNVFAALQQTLPSIGESTEYYGVSLNLLIVMDNSLHILPVDPKRAAEVVSFPLVNITSLEVSDTYHQLIMCVRPPFEKATKVQLLSASSAEIATSLYQSLVRIRGHWRETPLSLSGPTAFLDKVEEEHTSPADALATFRNTVSAYFSAYKQELWRFRYEIRYASEDAFHLQLIPPVGGSYNQLELLAIFRSLYYINAFETISFADICLDDLRHTVDPYGFEHSDSISTYLMKFRNRAINLADCNLLIQELCAVASTNRVLLHVDFSDSLSPSDGILVFDCNILQALYPLCIHELTNIEWISLCGIQLTSVDLEYLLLIVDERKAHIRGLNISRTGLNQQQIAQLMKALQAQKTTFESLDISDNGPCLNQCAFSEHISHFPYLQTLNLSNLKLSAGIPDTLIEASTLVSWRLQELRFDNTLVNEATVRALATYLEDDISSTLRILSLESSGLSGFSVSLLLTASASSHDRHQGLHLAVGGNPIQLDHDLVASAIRGDMTPLSLSLDRTDYQDQQLLRDLLNAIESNQSLRHLNFRGIRALTFPRLALSSLGALESCFANNTSLTDISFAAFSPDGGSVEHDLDMGVKHALLGLARRTNLTHLDLSCLHLNHSGAVLLSEIITSNIHLQELYCSHTNIPLTGLDAILSSLQHNYSILSMSDMEDCKLSELEEVGEAGTKTQLVSAPSRARKVFSGVESRLSGRRLQRKRTKRPSTGSELRPTISSGDNEIAQAWNARQDLLQEYLGRNRRLLDGGVDPAMEGPFVDVEGLEGTSPELDVKNLRSDSGRGSSFQNQTEAGFDSRDFPDGTDKQPLLGDDIEALSNLQAQLSLHTTGLHDHAEEESDDEAETLYIKT